MTIKSAIKVRPVRAEDRKHNTEVVKMINAAFQSSESWTSDSAIVSVDRISVERLDKMIQTSGTENVFYMDLMVKQCPRYQSRGIGGLLARESISYMKSVLKMRVAIVHVFQCKPKLLEWYQRMGFEDDGEVIPFFDKSLLIIDEAPLSVLKYRIF